MFNRLKKYAQLAGDDTMTIYEMKNGYLKCPKEWIVLNPEEASNREYALVVECRNSLTYGTENFGETIPHFVYFTETKRMEEPTDELTAKINQLCVELWENFQNVLDNQVEAICDKEGAGVPLNAEEWNKAPIIGYFPVYEKGDPAYGPNFEPPFGTMIVRKRGIKE